MINSAYTPPLDLIRRPRRNRQSTAIRALVRETRVHADDLIQPLFVKDGHGGPEEIASMIVYLCSELAGYVNGAWIEVDGAHHRSAL